METVTDNGDVVENTPAWEVILWLGMMSRSGHMSPGVDHLRVFAPHSWFGATSQAHMAPGVYGG